MQKILVTFFVGVSHALQALKQPAAWAVIAILVGLWWWKNKDDVAAKVVNQLPPIEFKPLADETGVTGGVKASPADEEVAAAIASGITDREKLPVMSSRDLEVAVGRFHKDNLRLPNDADELIEKKYLVGVPDAPPGTRYHLDLSPIQMRLVRK